MCRNKTGERLLFSAKLEVVIIDGVQGILERYALRRSRSGEQLLD
jgi:hypothetical protein